MGFFALLFIVPALLGTWKIWCSSWADIPKVAAIAVIWVGVVGILYPFVTLDESPDLAATSAIYTPGAR